MTKPKYPEIEVQLTGEDGNAFAIIGKVGKALRRQVSLDVSKEFTNAATSCGSYDELLALTMDWVTVH